MTTPTLGLRDVRRRAKELGCDVEVLRRSPLDCEVRAPDGKVFDGGLHTLVGSDAVGLNPGRVCADLIERMAAGVTDCEDETCDTCNDLKQEGLL